MSVWGPATSGPPAPPPCHGPDLLLSSSPAQPGLSTAHTAHQAAQTGRWTTETVQKKFRALTRESRVAVRGSYGKIMETSESSSQTQDHNRVPRETEDLDYGDTNFHEQDRETGLFSQELNEKDKSSSSSSCSSSEGSGEDQHPRVTRKHRRRLVAGHPHRDSSPGAEHVQPDVSKDGLQLYEGAPGEMVPSGESGLRRRGSDPASEVEASPLRRLNIKKDDEFFHFVLLCFAIGALLVCYHYYADWFISFGVGLITFASLETVGIYFGLVYRIHSVLNGFIPLFQKFRVLGFRRTD
ncbi:transmembrane protein 40 isoform X2 [Elephas maximus indicus]|uniref:transmembrane protein 40 isoform X2 n=1 Tax=Elephas maximus indicus TaxID=99487 RepID=UPI002116197E|nr:transmembrane protein 40 isoform X2 [Elephas maximus indicus]